MVWWRHLVVTHQQQARSLLKLLARLVGLMLIPQLRPARRLVWRLHWAAAVPRRQVLRLRALRLLRVHRWTLRQRLRAMQLHEWQWSPTLLLLKPVQQLQERLVRLVGRSKSWQPRPARRLVWRLHRVAAVPRRQVLRLRALRLLRVHRWTLRQRLRALQLHRQ